MAEDREDVFNEVIFQLGMLHDAMFRTQNQYAIGVKLAMEFVRSMKEYEA